MTDVNTAVTLGTTGEVPATALQRARDYARQAKSKETKRVYKVHWSKFEAWLSGQEMTPIGGVRQHNKARAHAGSPTPASDSASE